MNTFQMELLKLYKRKSTKVLIGVYACLLLLLSGLYIYGEGQFGITMYTEGQFVGVSLSIMMGFILPFITLYIASSSFSLDFGKGTIKNLLLLPIEKAQIFYGKIMAVQSLVGVLLFIQFAFTMIFGLFMDGFFTAGVFFNLLGEYLGAFVVLGLVNVLGATFYLLFMSMGLTVLMTYLYYMATTLGAVYFPKIKMISMTRFLNQYDTILTQINGAMLLGILSYYIILVAAGNLMFEEKAKGLLVDFE